MKLILVDNIFNVDGSVYLKNQPLRIIEEVVVKNYRDYLDGIIQEVIDDAFSAIKVTHPLNKWKRLSYDSFVDDDGRKHVVSFIEEEVA